MSDTLIITNTDAEWPMGAMPNGRIEGNGRRSWWRSLHGNPDSDQLKWDVSGIQLSRVSTDERLSVDMVLWLLSRIRGEYADPDGKEICLWLNKYKKTATIAIGGQIWSHDMDKPTDRYELRDWIDSSLDKTFKGK